MQEIFLGRKFDFGNNFKELGEYYIDSQLKTVLFPGIIPVFRTIYSTTRDLYSNLSFNLRKSIRKANISFLLVTGTKGFLATFLQISFLTLKMSTVYNQNKFGRLPWGRFKS